MNLHEQLEQQRLYKDAVPKNDCSIIEDMYFLGYNGMQNTIGELWIQTGIATCFQCDICVYLHSQLKNHRW